MNRTAKRFDDVAAERKKRGPAAAGSEGDSSIISKLEVDGKEYCGAISSDQNPWTKINLERVNAQTKTHAEAEAVQKAINGGSKQSGGKAEMWVDRDPCAACGPKSRLRSLARNLSVDELVIHSPSGSKAYVPTK